MTGPQGFFYNRKMFDRLTLRVLWSLTSALQTWLLAFLHAWVACQVACFTQSHLEIRIHTHQGTCQSMTNCARLACSTTAHDAHCHRISIVQIEHAQR